MVARNLPLSSKFIPGPPNSLKVPGANFGCLKAPTLFLDYALILKLGLPNFGTEGTQKILLFQSFGRKEQTGVIPLGGLPFNLHFC